MKRFDVNLVFWGFFTNVTALQVQRVTFSLFFRLIGDFQQRCKFSVKCAVFTWRPIKTHVALHLFHYSFGVALLIRT